MARHLCIVIGQGFGDSSTPLAVFTTGERAQAWTTAYNAWPDRVYTAIEGGWIPVDPSAERGEAVADRRG